MSYYGLTPGSTYYIEVDNFTPWGPSGTFDVCVNDQPDYDYPQGAIDLTSAMNGCSTGGSYSNVTATADHSAASCWSGGPFNNRWFKFTASSTTFINVQIKVSGTGETMRYPMVALWDAGLSTQLQCANQQGYGNGAVDLSMSYYGLTPGVTYYIEVDNFTPWGPTGSFDICVSSQPDYDYPQGAVVLTNLNNYCSSGGLYSNLNATPDHNKGSCWSGGPYKNRWFKFQAINTNMTATVEVNGSGETMRYPMIALWDATCTTQLACQNQAGYGNGTSNSSISYNGLVVGNWYYISVDNFTPWGTSGSFDICINNNSAVQYYSIGTGDWSNAANWSTTGFTGASAGTIPTISNIVNIQDHTISVTSAQNCQQINMTSASANTGLIINNAALSVYGSFNQTNSGVNNDMTITIQNTGTLVIKDNGNFTRNGGTNNFQLNINSGCSMTVGQDMIWTSTAGTIQNSQMNLNGNANLAIARDLTLSSTGGMQITHTINNTATVSVGRDISFSANAAGLAKITLNNSSSLSLQGNLVTVVPSYGILYCGSNATLIFNGTGTSQNILPSIGTGGDGFTYSNISINNTSGYNPSVIVTGPASMSGLLTLNSGIVQTTSTNLLTLTPTASSTVGDCNSTSFINGPLLIQKNTAGNSVLNFPIGKSADSRPISLTVNHANTNLYNYQAEVFNASAKAFGYTLPATVNRVSEIHYWTINRTDNAGTYQPSLDLSGNQNIQLYFGTNDGVIDGTNLTIVKNTSTSPTTWFDIGGSGAPAYNAGAHLTGSVASTCAPTAFNSFSTFTLGNLNTGSNPLPITLLSFSAVPNDNQVDIAWATSSETNTAYFTVERSKDGVNFESLTTAKAAGNSSMINNYSAVDANPYPSISYYRLKLINIDGSINYSKTIQVNFNASGLTFNIYPNPVSATAAAYLSVSGLSANTEIKVGVYDILGKKILSNNYTIGNVGINNFNISTNANFHPGLYIVIISEVGTDKILNRQKLMIR